MQSVPTVIAGLATIIVIAARGFAQLDLQEARLRPGFFVFRIDPAVRIEQIDSRFGLYTG
jgi:hypothetical protein